MSPIRPSFPRGRYVTDSGKIVCIGTEPASVQPVKQSSRRHTAILGIAFVPAAAEAKGCIKGAVVGGVAGHLAGHGKVGAVAGRIIGRHEANKRNAGRIEQKAPPSAQGNRI